METFETLEKRRSIRRFNNLPVEWEKVGNILRAAQLAPSTGNLQDYKLVVVTDKKKRGAIANAAIKQHWVATAPVIIVVFSEPKSTKRFYGLRGEKLYAIQNSAAVIQNILLAATDQGLGSCWVGAFDENMLNDALAAPSNSRPQAIIPIGYPSEEPEMPKRNDLYDIVYINSWGGKVVNFDLVIDNFSNVVKNKVIEGKDAVVENGPTLGKEFAAKSKEKIKNIHSKIVDKLESRKKKKEKALEKELGGEEEVLEDTEQEYLD